MSSSVVRLICPNLRCRSILAVPATARGKMVRCRNCGTRIQVPLPHAQPCVSDQADQTAQTEQDQPTSTG